MLDALEREHEEPDLLRELFAVDHLATRMRRNAENLVILGGALPARRWRNAVPVVNVLRSAVSETENYSRVVVQGVPRTSLSGQAVADVIHLIAELIENGTTFSPPYTQVQVSAQEVPKGLAVEVEDRGLGMGEEDYERLNDYLANPPELDVSALGDDLRLGLFVVARLAARHDIQVTLRPSPYGGTRAVVLVPSVLLEQAQPAASVPGLPAGARVTRTPVPELGQPADGGPTDGTDGGDELSGALAGVLGGLLGGGPTAAEGPLAGNADGAGGGTGTGEQQDGGLTVGELLAQYDRYGDAGAREAGPSPTAACRWALRSPACPAPWSSPGRPCLGRTTPRWARLRRPAPRLSGLLRPGPLRPVARPAWRVGLPAPRGPRTTRTRGRTSAARSVRPPRAVRRKAGRRPTPPRPPTSAPRTPPGARPGRRAAHPARPAAAGTERQPGRAVARGQRARRNASAAGRLPRRDGRRGRQHLRQRHVRWWLVRRQHLRRQRVRRRDDGRDRRRRCARRRCRRHRRPGPHRRPLAAALPRHHGRHPARHPYRPCGGPRLGRHGRSPAPAAPSAAKDQQ
ncbi:sensor histidine kinase [Kitasatospora aburaviensis]